MAIILKSFALTAAVALLPAVSAGQHGGATIRSVAHATTAPMNSHVPIPFEWQPGTPARVVIYPKRTGSGSSKPTRGGGGGGTSWTDPDLQTSYATSTLVPGTEFQGQSFTGAIPPDTNLSIGQDPSGNTQIVQVVNTSYAVYNTSGTQLVTNDLGALFAAMPNSNCYVNADGGDVLALFDKADHRWIMSQLAYSSDFTQNDYCIAISDTADATGTWELYDIPFGNGVPDYPKLGVWSDAVYFSANMFHITVNPITGTTSSTFLGAQACSFPRPSWTGAAPATISFTCSGSGNTGIYNILPADIDGPNLPSGSDYYVQFVSNLSSTSGNALALYQFNPTTGALTSLGTLAVGTVHEACGGVTCIPQSGTTQQLDSVGDRLMYRLSYRKSSDGTAAMVLNQSVQVRSAAAQTGIRWYRLCSATGSAPFTVCAQSTFSPDTATSRWMGSIAQDSAGNIGLGYSLSGSAAHPYPSISVAGAAAGSNAMQAEQLVFAGPNFQDTYNRWGDYSSMSLDPKDDCTFWYTTEYSTTTNLFGAWNFFWGTVIDSFHFPSCTANP